MLQRLTKEQQDKDLIPLYDAKGKQQRQSTLEEIVCWMNLLSNHVKAGCIHTIERGEVVARYTWTAERGPAVEGVIVKV